MSGSDRVFIQRKKKAGILPIFQRKEHSYKQIYRNTEIQNQNKFWKMNEVQVSNRSFKINQGHVNWKHILQRELKSSPSLRRSASFLQEAIPISFLSVNYITQPHLEFSLVTSKFVSLCPVKSFFLSLENSKDDTHSHSALYFIKELLCICSS